MVHAGRSNSRLKFDVAGAAARLAPARAAHCVPAVLGKNGPVSWRGIIEAGKRLKSLSPPERKTMRTKKLLVIPFRIEKVKTRSESWLADARLIFETEAREHGWSPLRSWIVGPYPERRGEPGFQRFEVSGIVEAV